MPEYILFKVIAFKIRPRSILQAFRLLNTKSFVLVGGEYVLNLILKFNK